MNRLFRKPSFGLIRRKKEETNCDTKSPSALEELPIEVKRHMASFLSVRDLLKVSETSKRFNKDLDVVVVSSPLTDRASQNKAFRAGNAPQCFAVVIPIRQPSLLTWLRKGFPVESFGLWSKIYLQT